MMFTLASCGGGTNESAENVQSENQAIPEKLELQEVANRTNLGEKLYITPQPALMIGTYDEHGNPDVMMAAWGCQCDMDQVFFCLSPHRTTTNIRNTREFTLSFATQRDIAQSDYYGIVSANDVPDKIAGSGLTVTKSTRINAPIINEYPITLECRVVEIMERGDDGCFVIGKIVNTIADSAILTDGRIDLDKLQPVVFDAATVSYRAVGAKVGQAWGSGKVFVKE